LSGDLDSITSVIDANEVTAQFPNATHVIVPNLGHVVADGDFVGCTLGIVERFVKQLSPGDTSCVNRVRPVRTVPRFARRASELVPLVARAGDKTSDAQRRIAAAALETVGDVIARYYVTLNSMDSGLRGGRYTYSATDVGYDWTLHSVRWTEDVAVSGTVSWDMVSNMITADLMLNGAGKVLGRVTINWDDAKINSVAVVTGTIEGSTLNAKRIAP
jgi:hypothetical protein